MAKIETKEVTVKRYTVTLTEEEAKGLYALLGHGTTGTTCDALGLKPLYLALDELPLRISFPYFQKLADLLEWE